MPIYYPSNGFSIDDIIKNNNSSKISNRSSLSYVPPITWLTPSRTSIYQFQHESIFQYLRHTTNQLTNSGFFFNTYRKPKRNRTAFTPSQLLKLENAFEKNHYIVGQERKELAKHLNLPEARVKVWYQNRRTKHKRLINEDGNSSTNESDCIIKHSDEHIWNNEENSKHYHLNLNHQQEKSHTN
ncbi:unnamed protein product [Rotaria sp. Silwood1]|nr:unnamed protein product [Rotaria sp. Silwood1]CAF1623878.1 unnamed protein product [Rotaria sp. Silwood1]CAF3784322.1 unnamed protein product [Rotaria sp. Silwood1]CAF5144147.1 unnamed protein product [Rotaria sp. Silwood1]